MCYGVFSDKYVCSKRWYHNGIALPADGLSLLPKRSIHLVLVGEEQWCRCESTTRGPGSGKTDLHHVSERAYFEDVLLLHDVGGSSFQRLFA